MLHLSSRSLSLSQSLSVTAQGVTQTQLLEADNWAFVKPGPVGPQPRSQTPSSSEDAPPGRR